MPAFAGMTVFLFSVRFLFIIPFWGLFVGWEPVGKTHTGSTNHVLPRNFFNPSSELVHPALHIIVTGRANMPRFVKEAVLHL